MESSNKTSAYRIVKAKYAASAFSGEGARLFGGRWNSVGRNIVYTASSISLAAIEMLAHLQDSNLLVKYQVVEITFDQSLVKTKSPNDLPDNWDSNPPHSSLTIGNNWFDSAQSSILQIPSAIIQTEPNFLLNPNHHDFAKITIGTPQPFVFDSRLIQSNEK